MPDDLQLYARDQLLGSLAKVSNKKYPKLKYTRYFPVVPMPQYAWKNSFEVVEFDPIGIATVMAGQANDGGLVAVVGRRTRYPVKGLSDYTRISYTMLKQSQAEGLPIEAKYASALVYGMEKKHNSIAYDGDTDYGLQGIFTSQVPRMNAATTLAAAATPRAQLDIINSAVATVVSNCRGIWQPTILALPSRQFNLLASNIYTDATGKTVLASFKETQTELGQISEIIMDDQLIGKGENGTDAALILPGLGTYDPDLVDSPTGDDDTGTEHPMYYGLPLEFTIPEEFLQWDDQVYVERAISRTTGLIVEDPLTGLILSGI